MNIYLQGEDRVLEKPHINVDRDTASYRTSSFGERKVENKTYNIDISGTVMDNNAYAGHGQTAEDVMQMAGQEDVTARRNYMAVMSNSISDEDFAKLQKEGFHPGSTDFETTVTIVDHIKAALVKGGTDIVGYTDTLSDEELCELTGSEVFARELKTQFHERDIPVTRENVISVTESYQHVKDIEELSDGTIKYMVENNMMPTADDLYMAQYSSSKDGCLQGKGYYADGGVTGYYAKKPENVEMEQLLPQMIQVIEDSKLEVSEETIQQAQWLVENGVPLDKNSLQRLHHIQKLTFTIPYDHFLTSVSAAIADGIPAGKADLTRTKTYLEEIQGKRHLEETRLQMSAEANRKLLRRGYPIDTSPMEDVVASLRQIEEQIAKDITGEQDSTQAVQKKALFENTTEILDRIKTAPLSFVFHVLPEDTLTAVDEKAVDEKKQLEAASGKYEEFMTAPRADLGDSIKKAFRNVEDILKELRLAVTQENCRAVRILGYNRQEINEENIISIKEKDALLTRVVEQMKPARVLQMIRQGVDPTQMKLTELENYLGKEQNPSEEMESYSKFLYKLEQEKTLTEEERDAYIGIYRLLHQIEKNDHAALSGAMLADMDLSLRNLLTVMRSTRKKSMDYTIDESFGGVERKESGIRSITSQIENGFQGDVAEIRDLLEEVGDQEAKMEFEQQVYEDVRKAMQTEEAVLQQLIDYEQPITPDNLTAMDLLLRASDASYKKLNDVYKRSERKDDLPSDGKTLLKQFTDKESSQTAYAEFASDIQDFLERETFSENNQRYQALDVKAMSDLYKQAGFLKDMAQEEYYQIPVEIYGSLTAIHLRVIHNKDQESKVTVTFSSELYGNTAAEFRYTKQGLSGYCMCSDPVGSRLLENEKELFTDELLREGIEVDHLYFAQSEVLNLKEFMIKQKRQQGQESGVSTETLYRSAKAFIEFVQNVSIREGRNRYEN